MKIRYVEIENILSIEKIRLNIGEVGLVLLDGWNYDDGTANGAGKTSILNSIAFGLYGYIPRKISSSEILRSGTKKGYVKVGIETVAGFMEVYRARPNVLKFYKNGNEIDITQEEFIKNIGLDYEQYLVSMYLAQTDGMRLISLNDYDKKDFFLKLMNMDSFNKCKEEVDGQIHKLKDNKSKLEIQLSSLVSRVQAYNESIIDTSVLEEEKSKIDIDSYKTRLNKIQNITKPDTHKIDELEEKLNNELRSAQRSKDLLLLKEKELSHIDVLIKKIKQPISTNISCPHCSSDFIFNGGNSCTIDDIKKARDAEMSDLQSQRDQLLVEIQELTSIGDKVDKIKETINKCKIKRNQELDEYNSKKELIRDLREIIIKKEGQIKSLQDSIDKNNDVLLKINTVNKSIEDVTGSIAIINEDMKVASAVSNIFSTTGAQAYILDSAIDVFNEKVSRYISMIWPNSSYSLLSFKEKKNGDIKAKFSEKFINGGKERSIGSLSGGEYVCLSMAIDFAIIDVLETMFGLHISPIMLDEPFNNLDASNRDRVLELLELVSSERFIIVIDHASEAKASFSDVIRVEKRNGVSRLV